MASVPSCQYLLIYSPAFSMHCNDMQNCCGLALLVLVCCYLGAHHCLIVGYLIKPWPNMQVTELLRRLSMCVVCPSQQSCMSTSFDKEGFHLVFLLSQKALWLARLVIAAGVFCISAVFQKCSQRVSCLGVPLSAANLDIRSMYNIAWFFFQ